MFPLQIISEEWECTRICKKLSLKIFWMLEDVFYTMNVLTPGEISGFAETMRRVGIFGYCEPVTWDEPAGPQLHVWLIFFPVSLAPSSFNSWHRCFYEPDTNILYSLHFWPSMCNSLHLVRHSFNETLMNETHFAFQQTIQTMDTNKNKPRSYHIMPYHQHAKHDLKLLQ